MKENIQKLQEPKTGDPETKEAVHGASITDEEFNSTEDSEDVSDCESWNMDSETKEAGHGASNTIARQVTQVKFCMLVCSS